ncbi:DgyrCDS12814 [Dimorphilus gyrociliatus]|uniref:DgyrCDS12814 n=1 Tax=Dimorphilus gyrociliatus TaxID=2664684 RepID=A0A7I8W8U1_9ANNE|nr:DgyrCDS12814 [Dimorphilus gyrociliatus]
MALNLMDLRELQEQIDYLKLKADPSKTINSDGRSIESTTDTEETPKSNVLNDFAELDPFLSKTVSSDELNVCGELKIMDEQSNSSTDDYRPKDKPLYENGTESDTIKIMHGLSEEVNALSVENKRLYDEINLAAKERVHLQTKLDKLECQEEEEQQQHQLDDLETMKSQLRSENDKEKAVELIDKILFQMSKMAKRSDSQQETKLKSLSEENKDLKVKVDSLATRLESSQTDMNKIRNENEVLSIQRDGDSSKKDILEEKIFRLQTELAEKEEETVKRDRDKLHLQEQLTFMQSEQQYLLKAVKLLEDKSKKNLEEQVEDLRKLQSLLNNTRSNIQTRLPSDHEVFTEQWLDNIKNSKKTKAKEILSEIDEDALKVLIDCIQIELYERRLETNKTTDELRKRRLAMLVEAYTGKKEDESLNLAEEAIKLGNEGVFAEYKPFARKIAQPKLSKENPCPDENKKSGSLEEYRAKTLSKRNEPLSIGREEEKLSTSIPTKKEILTKTPSYTNYDRNKDTLSRTTPLPSTNIEKTIDPLSRTTPLASYDKRQLLSRTSSPGSNYKTTISESLLKNDKRREDVTKTLPNNENRSSKYNPPEFYEQKREDILGSRSALRNSESKEVKSPKMYTSKIDNRNDDLARPNSVESNYLANNSSLNYSIKESDYPKSGTTSDFRKKEESPLNYRPLINYEKKENSLESSYSRIKSPLLSKKDKEDSVMNKSGGVGNYENPDRLWRMTSLSNYEDKDKFMVKQDPLVNYEEREEVKRKAAYPKLLQSTGNIRSKSSYSSSSLQNLTDKKSTTIDIPPKENKKWTDEENLPLNKKSSSSFCSLLSPNLQAVRQEVFNKAKNGFSLSSENVSKQEDANRSIEEWRISTPAGIVVDDDNIIGNTPKTRAKLPSANSEHGSDLLVTMDGDIIKRRQLQKKDFPRKLTDMEALEQHKYVQGIISRYSTPNNKNNDHSEHLRSQAPPSAENVDELIDKYAKLLRERQAENDEDIREKNSSDLFI